ncbi:MAG: hypothetical protein HY709_03660 [Candidatus Latescibacteria bacterium]|nr:hypothetical protein [Candidatus Latescibacterota bacterium]
MDHTTCFRVRLILALGLILFLFTQCGRDRHDPLSVNKNDGVIRFDLKLARIAVPRKIDKVRVIARNSARPDSVSADLVVDPDGKKATGSLSVPAGTGWTITAYAYAGGYLLYTGTSAPVNVTAGQTTDAGSIELKQTIPDLIIGRGIYLTKRPGDTQPLSPGTVFDGDSITVNLDYQNTGPVEATGWRYELYLDSQLYRFGDESTSANESKVLAVPWVAVGGTHTFEFRLDTTNQVKETDETNNILSMTFTVKVTQGIVAGERVGDVELGTERDEVTSLLGRPDDISDDGSYTYIGLGLKVHFNDSAEVMLIFAFPPYAGSTERGVKLGDSADTIAQRYGANYLRTDDEGGAYTYDYPDLGIGFGFDQSHLCVFIDVYSSLTSAKIARPGGKRHGRR